MRKLLLLSLALVWASGCQVLSISSGQGFSAGPYSGFASYSDSNDITEIPVQGTLALPSATEATLAFASVPLAGSLTLEINLSDKGQAAALSSDSGWIAPIMLTLGPDGCYRQQVPKGETPSETAICLQGSEIYLDLISTSGAVLELFIDPVPNAQPSPLEPPAAYTSEELFQRASTQDFDTRIEFEKVVAARLSAENAVKNLLPHFTMNDVLNVLSLNVLNILKAIGDIGAFAVPSNWTHAKEAEFQSQAEYYAWVAMCMDSGSMAMGLALALERDEAILSVLNSELTELQGVIDVVKAKEQDGLLQEGSSDQLQTALDTVTQARDTIASGIDDDRTSIAGAAGFINPAAITDVAPSSSDQPPAITLTEDEIDQSATSRSVELRQMSDLLAAAKLDKTGRYFTFLDPSGDSSGGMGFGWTDYIAIGQAEIAEIQDQTTKLQASILEKVHSDLELLSTNQQTISDASTDLATQNRLLDLYVADLSSGITLNLTDMAAAYETKSKDEVAQISGTYGVSTALIQLNRLMVSSDYEQILTSSQALMPSSP